MDEKLKDEAVDCLIGGGTVTFEVGGYFYDIAPAENYVGGEDYEGYFISEALGNVVYDNARYVIIETIKHLTEDRETVDHVEFS